MDGLFRRTKERQEIPRPRIGGAKKRPGESLEMPGRPFGLVCSSCIKPHIRPELKLFPGNPGTYKIFAEFSAVFGRFREAGKPPL